MGESKNASELDLLKLEKQKPAWQLSISKKRIHARKKSNQPKTNKDLNGNYFGHPLPITTCFSFYFAFLIRVVVPNSLSSLTKLHHK